MNQRFKCLMLCLPLSFAALQMPSPILAKEPEQVADDLVQNDHRPVFRLYNPNHLYEQVAHFYTTSEQERDQLVRLGWQYEEIPFYTDETDRLFVVYNPNDGEYHWTLEQKEKDFLISVGWEDRGVGWNENDERMMRDVWTLDRVQASYPYTGQPITPLEPEKNSQESCCYSVRYENNVNPGTATIFVQGYGPYRSTTKTFTIRKATADELSISGIEPSYPWSGQPVRPEPVVQINGNVLVKDRDYTLTYSNADKIGQASVTVHGIGSVEGSKEIPYTIYSQNSAPADVSVPTADEINALSLQVRVSTCTNGTWTTPSVKPVKADNIINTLSVQQVPGSSGSTSICVLQINPADYLPEGYVSFSNPYDSANPKQSETAISLKKFSPDDPWTAVSPSTSLYGYPVPDKSLLSAVKVTFKNETANETVQLPLEKNFTYSHSFGDSQAREIESWGIELDLNAFRQQLEKKYGGTITWTAATQVSANAKGSETVHEKTALPTEILQNTFAVNINKDAQGTFSLMNPGFEFGFTVNKSSEPGNEAKKAEMYRMYNPNSGEHFYTAAQNERDHLVQVGWKFEGIGWNAPAASKSPVYRLYNPNEGDHHYTLAENERDYLVQVGWKYEGIGWYSDDNKTTPLYRVYNPNARTGTHHYTTNIDEKNHLVKIGWRDESIGWYGL